MKKLIFAALVTAAGLAHAQFSADEVKQYLSGAGMGYAKAAELNQYPGPMHVLEHAHALGLSEQQRVATQQLMDAHKAHARSLGAKLVDAERALEELFRKGNVDQADLAERVRSASALQGEYRLSHLETHRRMRALLTEDQVKRYDALRGYRAESAPNQHKH
jgi:Spy/CpxP family protein refolding chaperone